MKKIPEDIKKFSILCFIIGIFGAGLIGWTHQKLADTRMALYETSLKIELLQKQGAQNSNLEQIEKNETAADSILNRITPILASSGDSLQLAQTLDSEGWKKLLNEKIENLNKNSLNHYPKDFCLGFSNFKTNMPENNDIFHLTIQLLATEELCKILSESKLCTLTSIRRASVEKNISQKSDFIEEKIENKEPYFLYPFELEFACKPEGLRRMFNGLLASKLIFIPQSIEVVNPTNPEQTLKNLLKESKEKSLFIVSGEEDIQIKTRLHLLLWKP